MVLYYSVVYSSPGFVWAAWPSVPRNFVLDINHVPNGFNNNQATRRQSRTCII